MAKVVFGGKEYGLRMDLYAMEMIEEEFGSIKSAFEAMSSGKQISATRKLFKIMANSYLSFHGEEENITGGEIQHADVYELNKIAEAIRNTVEESSRSETTGGGEADDEVHDAYLEEIDRKN